MKDKPKFCFFGNISGALEGKTIGGGELQVALLAKALALKGHQVVIIDPYAAESYITAEGIQLINIPEWNKGMRGIRLFRNRIPLLFKLLKDQKADYYYVRMRSFLHLIPYFAAKKNGARFIISIAQDIDVVGLREQLKYEIKTNRNISKIISVDFPGYLITNFLLKRADFVFLQHSGQVIHAKQVRGKVVVFPNIIDCDSLNAARTNLTNYIIHVGTLTVFKGSENLYHLIKVLDMNQQLIIVGTPDDKRSALIYEKLKNNSNVILKGRLDHDMTIQLIANANALINTSEYEGFPNIFLEAWATGVPVISLRINPGNVINKHALGIYCDGDLSRMKSCIESGETAAIDKNRLISYVKEFHDFNTAADRLAVII